MTKRIMCDVVSIVQVAVSCGLTIGGSTRPAIGTLAAALLFHRCGGHR